MTNILPKMEREGPQRREHDPDPSVMLPEGTKRAPKRKNPEGPTTVTVYLILKGLYKGLIIILFTRLYSHT
ncbi:hypothetical protein D9758_017521 [Tetrapyrgos nigripes]|uniref:Uncharacterized protein n=1 Tax=Tetrapyrgos nigripes TaxID=182062 RepID=A0A8H5C3N3_9AGAR|nr:hypothetical protein D9758_017521 [Tetrapyrgos nigripes]